MYFDNSICQKEARFVKRKLDLSKGSSICQKEARFVKRKPDLSKGSPICQKGFQIIIKFNLVEEKQSSWSLGLNYGQMFNYPI